YDTAGAQDVVVVGAHAWIADSSDGVVVLDVADPAAIAPVAARPQSLYARALAISPSGACLVACSGGIHVYDATDPAVPAFRGAVPVGDDARDLALAGDWAFVADDDWGLGVYAIPALATTTDLGATVVTPGYAVTVAGVGSHVLLGSQDSGLQVFDVAVPDSPALLTILPLPGFPTDMAVRDGYAFVASYSGGLQIVDVADPASPVVAGSLIPPGNASAVCLYGGHAFLIVGYDRASETFEVKNSWGGTQHIRVTYEFVRRPFDRPLIPQARVQNYGTTDLIGVSIPVVCTVYNAAGTMVHSDMQTLTDIYAGRDTLVQFLPWVPTVSEPCSMIVSVANPILPDDIPENDNKRFDCRVLQGAYTGVSPATYAWLDSDTTGGPTYAWIDTAGFNIAPNLGDNYKINIPTYFNFRYYDSTFNYVYVSANGWLAMGSSNPGDTVDWIPRVVPDTRRPNLTLYPYWDDLAMGPGFGNGHLYYRTLGTSPNRQFVLTWLNVNRIGADTTNGLTFQVITNENGIITFQYKDVQTGDPAYDYGRGITIGFENGAGTDGLTYLYARPPMSTAVNDLANRLQPGRAISIFRQRRDCAALEIVTPAYYEFPGPVTPQVKVQNYGTVSDSIQVFLSIRPNYFWSTT
ncbi:hypothetical protein HGA89_05580, partial [bacterium]|nr:hypothetical protein [bacterium]